MWYGLLFLFALSATALGGIAGLGGGILIKPFLDFVGLFSLEQTNLMSGITVLAMTSVSMLSFIRSSIRGGGAGETGGAGGRPPAMGPVLLLSAGSVAGGIAGNHLFALALERMGGALCGTLQSGLLFLTTLLILLTAIKELRGGQGGGQLSGEKGGGTGRERGKGEYKAGSGGLLAAGFCLGTFSSFLGIGGGPVNVAALRRLFSMDMKTAARTSLYLIFFAQASSLLMAAAGPGLCIEDKGALALFVTAGAAGGVLGRMGSGKLNERGVKILYICLLAVILAMVCTTLFAN